MQAPIVEIFSSVQGEGIHVGERHLFIRLHDCNLRCDGCDEFHKDSEMMSVADVIDRVVQVDASEGPHDLVSITGGEPLYHSIFLEELAAALIRKGFKLLLETNGTLADEMRQLLSYFSVISMDYKLPEVWHIDDVSQAHRAFLSVAYNHNTYVKMVISDEVDDDHFDKAISMIASFDKTIPLVLQPYGKTCDVPAGLSQILMSLQKRARRTLEKVLVLPRIHLSLGAK